MQKFFQVIGSLAILYIVYLVVVKIDPKFLSGDINSFLGGIGGFTFPFITAILSFLIGSDKKMSGEIGNKIIQNKINIFGKNSGDNSGDGHNRNNKN